MYKSFTLLAIFLVTCFGVHSITEAAAPKVNSVQPAAGMPGASVTITGSGFTARNNKVTFGNVNGQANVVTASSVDGKTLVFNVPVNLKCATGNIGCTESGINPTSAGQYNISISNTNGTSNSIMYTVTASYEPVIPLVITSITPGTVEPGEIVTITGSGFSEQGNRIKIADFNIENNPEYSLASDGKTITFTVPLNSYAPCAAKVCPPAQVIIPSGSHLVSVLNAKGESNRVPVYISYDLKELVKALAQEVKKVANTHSPVKETTQAVCEKPNFTERLRRASKGNEVVMLQKILIKEGLLPEGSVDGSFGVRTHLAVIKLQKKLGLSADGVVGTKTRAAIQTEWGQVCL